MSKVLKGIFIFLVIVLVLVSSKVYAATPTLEQIVNVFNNCSTVKEYAAAGSVWKASSTENNLTIEATANNETFNITYTLEGTILSTKFSENNAFAGSAITIVLVDSIGQLHGYNDGDLFTTLNSENITSYSVEKEGFEIKQLADKSCEVKVDISKKIPLMDFSDEYIKVSDLQNYKEFLMGNGSASSSKGNLWFSKSTDDEENIVLIAEKENLTSSAYKSILSIIEVMFDSSKASKYFKTNYSSLSNGNKEFTGFKVEVNPVKTETEENLIPSESNYKFARITINKNLVNEAIKDMADDDNNNDDNNDNNNDDNNDNTDDKKVDTKTNIKVEFKKGVVPENTVLSAEQIKEDKLSDAVKQSLKTISTKYVVYDITLLNDNVKVQPTGNVKVSIPIPKEYDTSKLVVYRIEDNGTKTSCSTKIENANGIQYASFETNHFSIYVLAEKEASSNAGNNKQDDTIIKTEKLPQTGVGITIGLGIVLILITSIVLYKKYYNYKDIK